MVDLAPEARARFADPLAAFGVYHDLDYNLYYLNIRRNVADRIAAYFAKAQ